MDKQKIAMFCLWLLSLLVLGACTQSPHPEQERLKEALVHAEKLIIEASLTGDTSRLPEALTDRTAAKQEQAIKEKSNLTDEIRYYEETTVETVRVAEYNPPEAIVIAKYGYEFFSYDPTTGKR